MTGPVGPDDDDADISVVDFSHRGVAYTIALDAAGVADFDSALAPYLAVARRAGGLRRRADRVAPPPSAPFDDASFTAGGRAIDGRDAPRPDEPGRSPSGGREP
ncbi:Lsr2 dimerization domain-containing protein [Serinibacter arcticus]|uniref:Lsr2 dimerization domain-containing protein n=1 Tax=Serinibacter arcticus TaxID=1655435 RepID=A0A4Z1DXS1_9MICO|nr:histone-like nucleoid-structuring protein Lsr2 [Serinibacter arcticus]TGO03870.1 hypothetical protein SERN_2882 [Serinibacter arcticus]